VNLAPSPPAAAADESTASLLFFDAFFFGASSRRLSTTPDVFLADANGYRCAMLFLYASRSFSYSIDISSPISSSAHSVFEPTSSGSESGFGREMNAVEFTEMFSLKRRRAASLQLSANAFESSLNLSPT